MRDLLRVLDQHPAFQRVARELRNGRSVSVEGLWGASMPFFVAAMATAEVEPLAQIFLYVTPHVEEAEEAAEDLALFDPELPRYFPAWESVEEDELPDAEVLSRRLLLLKELLLRSDEESPPRVIVAPVAAVLQRVLTAEALKANTLSLRKGEERPPEQIAAWLIEREFVQSHQVEVPGEFCRRGGILDVFPFSAQKPYRIEFFGDEIESIRTFDPETQLSLGEVDECQVTALLRSRVASSGRPEERTSLLRHLPPDTVLMLKEPDEVMSRAESAPLEGEEWTGREELVEACKRFRVLSMYAIPGATGDAIASFDVRSLERFGRDISAAVWELARIAAETPRVVVLCNNQAESQRLDEILRENHFQRPAGFESRIGRLSRGFHFADIGLALIAHHDLFHRYQQRRPKARYRHVRAIDAFTELRPGDYVVHVSHGIGRFEGMEVLEHEGEKRECLRIRYAEGALLFVPCDKIELVQKYVGGGEEPPPLSKLGGRAWRYKKERAAAAVADLAAEMLTLQAKRESQPGIAYPPDDPLQAEFEAAFIYEETEDQIAVNEEIKRDMQSPRPMDRLICGDVGYGKTELAMRAAFRAVMFGKQVAVLVPTTVLAAQHYQTFTERMADYPVNIEMLSRFRTKAEQADILHDLAEGRVDIVIGTHRLIQPDVRFHDLGLVIIDEEQRFGVEDKERLKRLRATVDVLTLTATPIPRTLHMSLLGIRDISSLNTPPRDRLAIHTRLWRFDRHKIRQAILRELSRDGQVFFVHNRVESIEHVAQLVRELVPEASVLVAHGQMPEHELQEVMRQFVDGAADVLVCTTIIESGLDIPNANTIIINRADQFGLADLHQLRGRVGRYKHRAYAYLLVPSDRPVTPVAEKRLKAIEEFAELGAGFRIAMRDLEIRGAGNILGREQHGHIAAVGYDMYCRLLEMAIRRLRNEPMPRDVDVSIALGLEAYLPESYVPDPATRIAFYRKLLRATTEADLDQVQAEMEDRFGKLPREAQRMILAGRLRLLADRASIRSFSRANDTLVIEVRNLEIAQRTLASIGDRCRIVDEKTIHLILPEGMEDSQDVAEFLLKVLRGEASSRSLLACGSRS